MGYRDPRTSWYGTNVYRNNTRALSLDPVDQDVSGGTLRHYVTQINWFEVSEKICHVRCVTFINGIWTQSTPSARIIPVDITMRGKCFLFVNIALGCLGR